MYPKSLQKLIDIFTKFPGIGPRQAGRFAFFILKNNEGMAEDLISALKDVKEKISFCGQCFRSQENVNSNLCAFCADSRRDNTIIAVVEKEADLHNLEKTSLYKGLYHVLGGVISSLDNDSPKKLHLKEMHGRVAGMLQKNAKCEVILATGSTAEGNMTALYIERVLEPLKKQHTGLLISRLGRGLSLGAELEYADEVTLKSALTNRK